MNEKITNALNDPKVDFALVPTPVLKQLLSKDEHPAIARLPARHKFIFLTCPDGMCVPVDRKMIIGYVEKTLSEDEMFILDRCDIRVIGNFGVHEKAVVSS